MMKHLIEKLEQKANQWLDTFDAQLHDPTIRVMTGEVFRDTPQAHPCDEQLASHQALPRTATRPDKRELPGQASRLQQANAKLP